MQVYQIHIQVPGSERRVAISEVLVSFDEAMRIFDETHPVLNPKFAVWEEK